MRLIGRFSRWAPGFLGRFVDRLGFSHIEDDEEGEAQRAPTAGAIG